ncbi:MAG: hypothetical protein EZS28_028654 [Streblomastix strix]|uniref:Uncharacterized protein n=1 Tax=Streblomastix strix TaxID=222440 RepID=A0A5J4V1B1_9EUKA|nr:MAG: hypothetical protein EZS28_028654 [Streblomastix strix]
MRLKKQQVQAKGIEWRSFKPESVRARSGQLQNTLDRRWREELVWPTTEPIKQSSMEQTSAYADILKSLSISEEAALGAIMSVNRNELPTWHFTDTYLMILSAGFRFKVIRQSANLYGWQSNHVLNSENQAVSQQIQETLEREAKLYGWNRNSSQNIDNRSIDRIGS